MQILTGQRSTVFFDSRLFHPAQVNQTVAVQGMIHSSQHMGPFSFIRLRLADEILQCVLDEKTCIMPQGPLPDESSVTCTGRLIAEPRAPHGYELQVEQLKVLARPSRNRPVALAKKYSQLNLETDLSLRPISLRHQRHRMVFRLQEGICRGFRDFLHQEGFTEIHTPKIVSTGAEGGSNIFRLDYFGRKAYLAQSPQLYKQIMVGVYQRVFEIGPVFRAEKHRTARHLNEYTSLDFEMGFIESFHDMMNMETAMLRFMFDLLRSEYERELSALEISVPEVKSIPCVAFSQAKQMVSDYSNRPIRDPYDLEPEEERLIGQIIAEKTGSDFVFVTHYPAKKRPFYTMNDPQDEKYTLSFDLLYKGLEVTTGGQRIHDYDQQVKKMQSLDMNPEYFHSYLDIHACGIPPHGGLGLGLERLLMQLVGAENIRETSLFPRDQSRLDP